MWGFWAFGSSTMWIVLVLWSPFSMCNTTISVGRWCNLWYQGTIYVSRDGGMPWGMAVESYRIPCGECLHRFGRIPCRLSLFQRTTSSRHACLVYQGPGRELCGSQFYLHFYHSLPATLLKLYFAEPISWAGERESWPLSCTACMHASGRRHGKAVRRAASMWGDLKSHGLLALKVVCCK